MTRYTVRKYSELLHGWTIYEQTFCMVDAYNAQSHLQGLGYKASITSDYVANGNE